MVEESAQELAAPIPIQATRRRGGVNRSERELIRAARGGSADAAGELARRHWDEAHHAAYLIVRDAAGAEDVAQDAILAALESLRGFDRRRAFRPWLHRIVTNRSIDWLRARERRGEVRLDATAEPTPVEVEAVLAGNIGAALSSLDPHSRAIVVLRCIFDYRSREIAEMLGTTPGAVRTRLHRALEDLRRRLREEDR